MIPNLMIIPKGRASAIYLIFEGSELAAERRIELAIRAGVSCVYLADVFDKWGHFTVNTGSYPGGVSEIRELSDKAWAQGVTLGIHALSNFIKTHDDYVTSFPHKKLLVMDETVLTSDLKLGATEIHVRDANNFEIYDMNVVRLVDELITYEHYDSQRRCLTNCQRGAFGTVEGEYSAGIKVSRLWCYGYCTLFPDIDLQKEMADNLSRFIRKCGIRRISFDGLEGCTYTGTGQYAPSEYVRRVYENVGSDLRCKYLWSLSLAYQCLLQLG